MKPKTKIILVSIYLVVGLLVNVISSNLIAIYYPSAPTLPDIFLDSIDGNYWWAMKLSEVIIGFCIISFYFVAVKNKQHLIKWMFIFATFYLFRGLMLPLTIYSSVCSSSFLNSFKSFSYGMFPSGHTSIPFLLLLFSYKKNKLWIFYLLSTIVVGFLLLLGKQHYTIDILGTIFIGYSIKCFTEKNIFREKC